MVAAKLRKAYVFDVDGTIANCDHRVHHIRGPGKKDWDSFYAGQLQDPPIPHMVHLAVQLSEVTPVLIVTGRPMDYRRVTTEWLRTHLGDCWDGLYMRDHGDFRDDSIVKVELMNRVRADGYEVVVAFEDRTRVVEAYRAAGIPCAQVAPGDF